MNDALAKLIDMVGQAELVERKEVETVEEKRNMLRQAGPAAVAAVEAALGARDGERGRGDGVADEANPGDLDRRT